MPRIYEKPGSHIEFWDLDPPIEDEGDIVAPNRRDTMSNNGDYHHGIGEAFYPNGSQRTVDIFVPSGEVFSDIDSAAQIAAQQIGAKAITIIVRLDGLEMHG